MKNLQLLFDDLNAALILRRFRADFRSIKSETFDVETVVCVVAKLPPGLIVDARPGTYGIMCPLIRYSTLMLTKKSFYIRRLSTLVLATQCTP